jgi:hypothetical protein
MSPADDCLEILDTSIPVAIHTLNKSICNLIIKGNCNIKVLSNLRHCIIHYDSQFIIIFKSLSQLTKQSFINPTFERSLIPCL